MYKLVVANRNYSSWSLRAWLYLRESKISFEEIQIPLFTGNWKEEILRYSPAGRVPVLLDGDITVWDTMAIIEYVREKHSSAVSWPGPARMRAHARSISAEMHSGFLALRDELPQNLRCRKNLDPGLLTDSCRQQIARIEAIWTDCRSRYGEAGEWLFGEFSIADIMFVPVALRFATYEIPLGDKAREFVEAVQGSEYVQQWIKAAKAEPETLPFIDQLLSAASSPLTLG